MVMSGGGVQKGLRASALLHEWNVERGGLCKIVFNTNEDGVFVWCFNVSVGCETWVLFFHTNHCILTKSYSAFHYISYFLSFPVTNCSFIKFFQSGGRKKGLG